jgi:hypothetical protein
LIPKAFQIVLILRKDNAKETTLKKEKSTKEEISYGLRPK